MLAWLEFDCRQANRMAPKIVRWLLVALAPTEDVFQTETSIGRAVFIYQRLGELEDEQVPRIYCNIHFASQSEILLCIVLVCAIDNGIAAEGVACIDGDPEVGGTRIADVSFESG